MRILVVGAGALGGYYGGCLLHAGRDVTFLVRSRRAEQLARDGLRIIRPQGDFTVTVPTVAADDIRGSFDIVLLCVKAYSLQEAMEDFALAVGPKSSILPILNGLAHLDSLTSKFAVERVLGGTGRISATLDSEGHVTLFFPGQGLTFGELSGGNSERIRQIESALNGAGFKAAVSETILQDMWEKFVQLGSGVGINCLMRANFGDILAAPGGREIMRQLFDECCAVAAAATFEPRSAAVDATWKLMTTALTGKASMLRDIERGAMTEGEHILGDMVTRARALGVETPVLNLARINVAAYEAAECAKMQQCERGWPIHNLRKGLALLSMAVR